VAEIKLHDDPAEMFQDPNLSGLGANSFLGQNASASPSRQLASTSFAPAVTSSIGPLQAAFVSDAEGARRSIVSRSAILHALCGNVKHCKTPALIDQECQRQRQR